MKMTTNVQCFQSHPSEKYKLKTTQRFHLSSIRLTKFKRITEHLIGKTTKKQALSYVAGESANQHSPSGGI